MKTVYIAMSADLITPNHVSIIQKAGDTVLVAPGTYKERVRLKKGSPSRAPAMAEGSMFVGFDSLCVLRFVIGKTQFLKPLHNIA